ncbi:MAG: flagellar hook-associated family protein [Rhizobium sp.]
MSTSNVSNLSIQTSMRLTIRQAQNELIKSQNEVSTGIFYDVGAELGGETASTLDLTRDGLRLQSMIDTNAIATQRLESSQESLSQMSAAAQEMQDALISLGKSGASTTIDVATQTISNALNTFTSVANTSVGGEYLFAGINTDVQPLTPYDATSAAKVAFDTAFASYPWSTPKTAAEMDDFITNVVEPMYSGANWNTDWSSATDQVMTSRISQTEVVDTSSSANSNGMRYFALAAVLSKELLGLDLHDDVRSVVSQKAIAYTGVAIAGINSQRTQLGMSQNRVEKANASLQVQIDILDTTLKSKIEVDAYDASTRVNNLLALVEASYTLTSKIQGLSLVNYL